MGFSRFVVVATGLIFAVYGIACLLNPSLPAGYIGINLGRAGGTVEVMAMYGGLQAGFGALLVYMGLERRQIESGLKLIIVLIGSLAASRVAGLIIYGQDDYNVGAAIFEVTTTVLALIALLTRK